jgi:hypothetical protein
MFQYIFPAGLIAMLVVNTVMFVMALRTNDNAVAATHSEELKIAA